jgi:hypothetical protein
MKKKNESKKANRKNREDIDADITTVVLDEEDEGREGATATVEESEPQTVPDGVDEAVNGEKKPINVEEDVKVVKGK